MKHSRKKIVQLLWTIVTYSLKNVEQGIEHGIDDANGIVMLLLMMPMELKLLSFTADLINTLQFRKIINLTVF